jgi:hypothetical protein
LKLINQGSTFTKSNTGDKLKLIEM